MLKKILCRLSWSVSSNFGAIHLKYVPQLKIAKKTKNFYFGGSRASTLMPLKTPSVLVMISGVCVLICNSFHASSSTF